MAPVEVFIIWLEATVVNINVQELASVLNQITNKKNNQETHRL